MDMKKRSWVKSLVWRLIGIIVLGLISFLVTNSLKEMTIITLIFHSFRFVMYYFHERVWEHISWGKIKHPLADLPVKGRLAKEDLELIKEQLKTLGYIN